MKRIQLSSYRNDWYNPGSRFKILSWFIVNVLFFRNPLNGVSKVKVFLLRLFGANVGNNVTIKPGVNIKYPWLLSIGNDVWIGENVWIDNLTQVKIGNDVCISQGAFLLTGNHNYKKSSFDLMLGRISIEDGAWVGAKATVCPGVTCQSHSVLAVGSVATKDLAPFQIYQGNPAVAVRKRVLAA